MLLSPEKLSFKLLVSKLIDYWGNFDFHESARIIQAYKTTTSIKMQGANVLVLILYISSL